MPNPMPTMATVNPILLKFLVTDTTSFGTPIKLTNKIVVDVFGFIKNKKSTYGYKFTYPILDWGFVIENSYKKDTFFFGHEHYDSPNPKECYITFVFCFDLKYVHQLQQLFLAIKPINRFTLEPIQLELNAKNF